VTVARGDVHEPAFGQQVQDPPVLQRIAVDKGLALLLFHRHGFQVPPADFHVEMARVGQEHIVLHPLKVAARNDVRTTCRSDEDIAQRRGLVHCQDLETVHRGFQGPERVDLGNDDPRAQTLGTFGDAAGAVAVPGHDDGLAREHDVGRIHQGVPDRLARAMMVVKEVFTVGVVDGYHGEVQFPGLSARLEAQYARRGFLRPAQEVDGVFGVVVVEHLYEIPAVVYDEVRAAGEGFADVLAIFFRRGVKPGVDLEAVRGERRAYVVLGRQGVASRGVYLRARRPEHVT